MDHLVAFVIHIWIKLFRIIPEFRILKVILKMLNWGEYSRFSDLYSVCLKKTDHLNLKVLRSEFQKFRIFVILNFHPCTLVNILTGQQTYPVVTHNSSQNENPQKKQEQMG